MSNLYHIILLYPVEPCALLYLFPLTNLYRLASLTLPLTALYTFSCLRSRSFHSLWRLPSHAVIAPYLSPILPRLAPVAPSYHPQIHQSPSIQHAHSHSTRTQPFRIWSHCRLSDFRCPSILSVLSRPSSCLTPHHTHPFTCNSVDSNNHRSALQKRPASTAERTSLYLLNPPLPHLVIPSAFALSLSFFHSLPRDLGVEGVG